MLRDSIDPVKLGELADSIATEGLHQRIGVIARPQVGFYTIIYGHRRLLAHKLLNRPHIPAKVYPPGTDVLQVSASENLQREQLTPMEEAATVQKFFDRGETLHSIARLFRRTPAWVAQRQRLLSLPEELQASIHQGRLPMSVAEVLADVDHDDYRESLIEEAIRTGANAATAGIWVMHYKSDPARYAKNRATVEEIRQNREKFVLHVECEGCNTPTPYGDTRALRLCPECDTILTKALREPAAPPAAG